jgi:hypothetical protein
MPHVSKEKMDEEVQEKFFRELTLLIAKTTRADSLTVIDGLLTETEKVMLTKRLAAALLFSQGHSSYTVWNTLKISPSTAQKISYSYKKGRYKELITIAYSSKHKTLLGTLELILRAGMPSRGRDRWKFLSSR